jgi:hypothetical protein
VREDYWQELVKKEMSGSGQFADASLTIATHFMKKRV